MRLKKSAAIALWIIRSDMGLKDIFCQQTAMDIFQQAMASDRVAHSYIFSGMDGIGKFTSAKEFAKVLLCEHRQSDLSSFIDSCGYCKSCKLFEGDSHPDFHHIYKELYWFTEEGSSKGGRAEIEAAQSIEADLDEESPEVEDKKKKKKVKAVVQLPISVIREFFLDKVNLKPSMGKNSVYVISETEKLNASSQNAMLKVLEEPPAHCIIILLCSGLEKLLPTTRSRCQIVRFGSIDEQIIVDKLIDMGAQDKQSLFWARWTNGSLGRAIRWHNLDVYDTKLELIKRLCRFVLSDTVEFAEWLSAQSKAYSSKWAEDDARQSKSDITRMVQKALIDMIVSAYTDSIKLGCGMVDKLTNFDQVDEIKRLMAINDGDESSFKIENCQKTKYMIDSSVNEKLLWEQLLINLGK